MDFRWPTASIIYDDDFLSVLGAWQRGWNEDQAHRLAITDALLKAIATRPSDLPRSASQGTLYRKRFLIPNMRFALIWSLIDEGGTASGKSVTGRSIGYRAIDASIVAYIDLPLEWVDGRSISELWFGPRNGNGPGNAIYPLTKQGHSNVVLHRSGSSYRG